LTNGKRPQPAETLPYLLENIIGLGFGLFYNLHAVVVCCFHSYEEMEKVLQDEERVIRLPRRKIERSVS
jgi:hypothetical protein